MEQQIANHIISRIDRYDGKQPFSEQFEIGKLTVTAWGCVYLSIDEISPETHESEAEYRINGCDVHFALLRADDDDENITEINKELLTQLICNYYENN